MCTQIKHRNDASSRKQVRKPNTVAQLEKLLARHGVDISSWGQPGTKSVSDLFAEMENGESELVVINGELVRTFTTAGIDIFTKIDGKDMYLHEISRTLRKGKTAFDRTHDIDVTISQKKRKEEVLETTAARAIQEQLGFSVPFNTITRHERRTIKGNSTSYPGLPRIVEQFSVATTLSNGNVRPRGYVFRKGDVTTIFEWAPIKNNLRKSS